MWHRNKRSYCDGSKLKSRSVCDTLLKSVLNLIECVCFVCLGIDA